MSEDQSRTQGGGSYERNSFPRDKDAERDGGKYKKKGRRKVSYLTLNKIETVDYKDVPILRRFINDRGKILPSRQSGNTAKQQRMIARAIRRARELALLPFVVQEMSAERREFGPRRDRPQRDYDRGGDRGDRGGYSSHSQDRGPAPQAPAASAAPAAPAEAPAAPAPETPAAE